MGRHDEATQQFQKALQLSPKSGKVHYMYAMDLVQNRKLDEAMSEFRTALAHDPKHPEAHFHLGRALYLKGDLEGARVNYEETARLNPKAPVHNSLGVVYMKLGQRQRAIEQFQEALRQRPDDESAAENLRFAQTNETVPARRQNAPPQ